MSAPVVPAAGAARARVVGVGVRTFKELIAWQLAAALRDEIVAVTDRPPAAADRNYCDQLRGSAASAAANIAEGFARFGAKEFARGLLIARGELAETENHLEDGLHRHYLSEADYQHLATLAKRAFVAVSRLHASLRTHINRRPRR